MKTIITMTKETYSRTDSGKSWRSKPDAVEIEQVSPENHRNATCDDTLRFFRRLGGSETVVYGYTSAGYLPVKVSSVSPDGSTKHVRRYDIKKG